MALYRLAVIVMAVLPSLFGEDQAGAKALFLDPTSGVSVQSSGAGGVKPRTPERQVAATPKSTPLSAPKEGDITGLRYWLELQSDQGQLLRVNSSRVFKSGERIRLHIESNVDGNLTILQSQSGGAFSRLFPNGTASGRIEKFKDQVFPSKVGWFRFDSSPGDIRLMVMVQSDEQPATGVQMASKPPESGVAASGSLSQRDDQKLEAHMRAQIDLLKGSKALVVEDDASTSEAATYVVADYRKASAAEKGLVAVEVKLAHR